VVALRSNYQGELNALGLTRVINQIRLISDGATSDRAPWGKSWWRRNSSLARGSIVSRRRDLNHTVLRGPVFESGTSAISVVLETRCSRFSVSRRLLGKLPQQFNGFRW
jgi:hypothetical protein